VTENSSYNIFEKKLCQIIFDNTTHCAVLLWPNFK